jgi:hypothetical protein
MIMVAPYIKRRRLAAAKKAAEVKTHTNPAPKPKAKPTAKPQKKSMWSSKKQTSRKSD